MKFASALEPLDQANQNGTHFSVRTPKGDLGHSLDAAVHAPSSKSSMKGYDSPDWKATQNQQHNASKQRKGGCCSCLGRSKRYTSDAARVLEQDRAPIEQINSTHHSPLNVATKSSQLNGSHDPILEEYQRTGSQLDGNGAATAKAQPALDAHLQSFGPESPRKSSLGNAFQPNNANTNSQRPSTPRTSSGMTNGIPDFYTFATNTTTSTRQSPKLQPASTALASSKPSGGSGSDAGAASPLPTFRSQDSARGGGGGRQEDFYLAASVLTISKTPNGSRDGTPLSSPLTHSPHLHHHHPDLAHTHDPTTTSSHLRPSAVEGRIAAMDGRPVECAPIERLVQSRIEAIHHCMLVDHPTSDEVGCLITLRSAGGGAALALHKAGLELADESGSEATTVMSARQCHMFRRGLAEGLGRVNHDIVGQRVQIRRFQVLREHLSVDNGLLRPDGELNRRQILHRYRHIVDDMYNYNARYPHRWMGADSAAAAGGGAGPPRGPNAAGVNGGNGRQDPAAGRTTAGRYEMGGGGAGEQPARGGPWGGVGRRRRRRRRCGGGAAGVGDCGAGAGPHGPPPR